MLNGPVNMNITISYLHDQTRANSIEECLTIIVCTSHSECEGRHTVVELVVCRTIGCCRHN